MDDDRSWTARCNAVVAILRNVPCKSSPLDCDLTKGDKPAGSGVHLLLLLLEVVAASAILQGGQAAGEEITKAWQQVDHDVDDCDDDAMSSKKNNSAVFMDTTISIFSLILLLRFIFEQSENPREKNEKFSASLKFLGSSWSDISIG